MRPHPPPLASFRKIQGLPISKIVRTADNTIIIITKCSVREDFLGFIPLGTDLTGAAIAKAIIDELRRVDIDTTYMIGQGYDDASSMSGSVLGVQTCIRQVCPSAVYVHCASHCLNLTISRSCDIPSIRNCQGVVSEIAAFFNHSAKHNSILKQDFKAGSY